MLNKNRFISLVLCMALWFTLMIVPGFAAGTVEYIINENFEGTPSQFTSGGTVIDSGNGRYGKVLKLSNASAAATTSATVDANGTVGWVFTSDIYLENTTTRVEIKPHGLNFGGSVKECPKVIFTENGKIQITNEVSSTVYTAGWHNVTIFYAYMDGDANGGVTNALVFIDGKRLNLENNPASGLNSANELVAFKGVNIVAQAGGTVYIDNVMLIKNTEGSFFAEGYYDGTNVYVKTSNVNTTANDGWNNQGAMNGFDGTKLYDTITGEEIACTSVSQTGKEYVMKPSQPLSKGREYVISLPNTMRSFNGIRTSSVSWPLASTEITFVAENGVYTDVCAENVGLLNESSDKMTAPSAGTAYASAKIVNPTEDAVEVKVIVAAQSGFSTTAVDSKSYTVAAGIENALVLGKEGAIPVDGSSAAPVYVTASGADDTLDVFVLLKKDNGYDLIGQNTLTSADGEITECPETFTYTGTASNAKRHIVYEFTTADKITLIHADSLKSDADKAYTLSFNVPVLYKSGNYNLTVYEYGAPAVDVPVTYINTNEWADAVEEMSKDKTKISEILSTSAFLFIDSELADDVDYDKIEILITDYIEENGELTEENAQNIIDKAVYITAAQEGLLDNVFSFADKFDFANSSIKDFYTDNETKKDYVGATVQGYVTDRLKNTTASSFEDFDADLKEAFVLSVVQYPDGIANLKEVLNAFCSEIGIEANASSYKYKAVENKNYSDYDALAKDFNNAEKPDGGGTGSSGGYTRPSSDRTSIGVDYIEKKEPEKLIYNIFTDVTDEYWGREAIVKLAQKGIINGKGDGAFYPEDYITREEFVKIIVETLEFETGQSEADFYDVDKNEWYYPYIATAVKNGIITGYEDRSFGVGQNITRQDMCVILYRAASIAEYEFVSKEKADFKDLTSVSDYARESVGILSAEGIINGYDTGEFKPLNNSTRTECATVVYNFLNLFNEI